MGVEAATIGNFARSREELLAQVPELDRFQTGHLRHIENIARQLPNDWANMGTQLSWQENFEAFRYQLAYMAYAVALTHFHRLPAAPGYFRQTFDDLIQKMLLPDVWYFWRETSRGGGEVNKDAPISPGQVNPIDRDNIMYSAYLQSMSALYNVLFDDDKYTKPGALTMKFNPFLFRTDQCEDFAYDQNSINEHLYWRMVESGYLGIACEPFCTFQICQQPAILGFRLNDVLNGTDRATEVTEGFAAAWKEFGQFDEQGHYTTFVKTSTGEVQPNQSGAWSDGWLGTLLNMWSPDLVKGHYPEGIRKWVKDLPDGTSFVPPYVPEGAEGADVSAGSSVDFGWCCTWASEVGDQELLSRFLGYADKYLSPKWKDGGYYYPRNDKFVDEDGNAITVSPQAGNALLPYARLNVPDGLNKLYNAPWGPAHFAEPLITEISDTVDVTRARWLPEPRSLVFSLARREGREGEVALVIANVFTQDGGSWHLNAGEAEIASGTAAVVTAVSSGIRIERVGHDLHVAMPIAGKSDFILQWQS